MSMPESLIRHAHRRREKMKTNAYGRARRLLVSLVAVALFATPLAVLAQTRISYHSNKYSPNDDVKAGQQAAREVEQQMPIMHDQEVEDYVSRIGQRLVEAIPQEFQHPEFR